MEEHTGHFVSVILTNEARIEGILHHVDLRNELIVVKNARNFGSEGRRLQGPQIPPSLHIHDSSTLRSRQIKDMEIIYLSSQERDFPSLSQHRVGARNHVDRPSYSEVTNRKKN